MGTRLKKITVNKIAILTEANPANKFPLTILKSDGNRELLTIMKSLFDGEDGLDVVLKAAEELPSEVAELMRPWVKEISQYIESCPDSFADALKALLKEYVMLAGDSEDEEEEEEVQKLDPDNPWERLPEIKPAYMIKSDEPEIEEEPDDEDNYDPIQIRLARIEKKLDGEKEKVDNWPSLSPITPGMKIPIKKSQAGPKLDPNAKQLPVKKGLGIAELHDDHEIIKKADDEIDNYPSIPDSLFELN